MARKVLIGVMLFFMAVSVPVYLPSCSKSSNPGGPNGGIPGINTPTNNYRVSITVLSFGGVNGCAGGSVSQDVSGKGYYSKSIKDAEVTINSTRLDTMDGEYFDSTISTAPGTPYSLTVRHLGTVIASGSATMPSVPVITSPANKSHIAPNMPVSLQWGQVQYTTSIIVEVDKIDSINGDSTVYESASLDPAANSCSIPGTAFSSAGEYYIVLVAANGVPVGLSPEVHDTVPKGYNITGAAGTFYAANWALDTVLVGFPKIAVRPATALQVRTALRLKLERMVERLGVTPSRIRQPVR